MNNFKIILESNYQLQDYLARQRQKRPENQALSALIKKRLRELEKNKSWLAGEMGITRQSVSNYINGKLIPKKDSLKLLFSSLGVPYKTIEELLE